MISRYFNVYLNAGVSVAPVINVNQYDRGEQWIFTLLHEDGTKFTPASGAICGVKSDGHGILNSATIDSSGRVVVTETEQMTAAAGQAVFELSIDGQSHGTANFVVMVERKPTDQAVMSDSDYSFIQQAVDTVEADTEIVEQATAAVASIVPSNPGTAGQVLTRASSGAVWADAISEGSIATVEGATASRNFSAGEYIVRNGILCKVVTNVSAGTAWDGTNSPQTNVGSELKANSERIITFETETLYVGDLGANASGYSSFTFSVPSGYQTTGIFSVTKRHPGGAINLSIFPSIPKGMQGSNRTVNYTYATVSAISRLATDFTVAIECEKI